MTYVQIIEIVGIVTCLLVAVTINRLKEADSKYSKFGGRKFTVSVLLLLLTFYLSLTGRLVGHDVDKMFSVIAGGYGLLNLIKTIISKRAAAADPDAVIDVESKGTTLSRKYTLSILLIGLSTILCFLGNVNGGDLVSTYLIAAGLVGLTVFSK